MMMTARMKVMGITDWKVKTMTMKMMRMMKRAIEMIMV